MAKVAIITGTGVPIPSRVRPEPMLVRTRYGAAELVELHAENMDVVLLPRHGRNHALLPHQINHRANIAALAKRGVRRILATNAVGALRTDLPPGSLVLLSDFIDFTRFGPITMAAAKSPRKISRAHTDFSNPYCPELRSSLLAAAADATFPLHPAGTYVCVTGPRFETPAEVRLFAAWGGDVVGMTGLPEAVFARECGICYAAVAIVANLGAGLGPAPIDHDAVVQTVSASANGLLEFLLRAIPRIPAEPSCGCGRV